jgi:hypothetical protein
MRRTRLNGVVLYRFDALQDIEGLLHAVLTRIGGVSQRPYATLNLGHTVGDEPEAVEENHHRALTPLGLKPDRIVSPWQVHGAEVEVVERQHLGTVRPKTDALVTAVPGVPLMMRFGDCAPVLFCDPARRVVGMAHAGWRGVVAGVLQASVRTLTEQLSCQVESIWAGVGPTIGPCCYDVGANVARDIACACPSGADVVRRVDGQSYADLPAAVEAQLRAAGIQRVDQASLCTSCRVDEFFSHRAENGRTGRFGVVIGWEDD